jgi:hypothetical protein
VSARLGLGEAQLRSGDIIAAEQTLRACAAALGRLRETMPDNAALPGMATRARRLIEDLPTPARQATR